MSILIEYEVFWQIKCIDDQIAKFIGFNTLFFSNLAIDPRSHCYIIFAAIDEDSSPWNHGVVLFLIKD